MVYFRLPDPELLDKGRAIHAWIRPAEDQRSGLHRLIRLVSPVARHLA